MTDDSLKAKTVKGVGWSALENVSSYLVTFIVGVILARILTPDDYGLIGLTGVLTAVCGCFINAGFDNALIRKKDVTEIDYSTVFVINICASSILYVFTYFCAPLIADFFDRQELVPITRVISLGMILGALSIVPRVRLTKRLDFKSQTKITVIISVIRGIVGVSTALLGLGVWALVIQSLVGSFLSSVFLLWIDKWIPSLRFSLKSFKELFGFGSKLLASALLDTMWTQCYQVVIGKCYAPATLGQYARANSFSDIFSCNLTSIVQRVSYPVLSEMQEDRHRLREGYRRIIKSTMLFSFCSMLMLAAVARPMILVFVGEKWLQAADFLQIICFSAMLYPLHSINLNMLQVLGRSDLFLKLEIIKKIIAIVPILIGIFVGIYWMLISGVFIGLISYYLNAYYSGKFLNYSIWKQISDVLPAFSIAICGAVVAYGISILAYSLFFVIGWKYNFLILLVQIVIGYIIMFSLFEIFRIEEFMEVKNMLKSINNKIKLR